MRRRGYTLIDATVALSIAIVLSTVLIPGCFYGPSGGRPPAHRSQCKNNLKQFGIALHVYHDRHNTLPPGWIAVQPESERPPLAYTSGGVVDGQLRAGAFGWHMQLLPFWDQPFLFEKFDCEAPEALASTENRKLAATVLMAARCPSDVGPQKGGQNPSATSRHRHRIEFATTNYVGNFGVGTPEVFGEYRFSQGVFSGNSKVRFRDLKDGTSNVIFVGERRMPRACGEWPAGEFTGSHCSAWAGLTDIAKVSPLSIVATMTEGSVDDLKRLNHAGPLVALETPGEATYFGINRQPDGTLFEPDSFDQTITAGFSSYHKGGAQVLLGDGTVRFINENIDRNVLVNMTRRADGETLGEF